MVELDEKECSSKKSMAAWLFAVALAPMAFVALSVAGISSNSQISDSKTSAVVLLVLIVFAVVGALVCKTISGQKEGE